MKKLSLAVASLVVGISTALDGGAWQTGVPGTGTASATNQNHKTDVTIDDETLKIDLHPEYAAVEVRYRMHTLRQREKRSAAGDVEIRDGKPPLVELLSSRVTCVKINAPWLCDCRNRITRTSSESSSWILPARRKPLH